jgi:hypothetical protein
MGFFLTYLVTEVFFIVPLDACVAPPIFVCFVTCYIGVKLG